MQLRLLPDGGVRLSGMNDWTLKFLQHIPILADPSGHEGATRRVYQPPVTGPGAEDYDREEWDEYVTPELKAHYENALDVVASETAGATPEFKKYRKRRPVRPAGEPPAPQPPPEERPTGLYSIMIAAGHVEHWYRAMNQARLVMEARYGVASETDDEEEQAFDSMLMTEAESAAEIDRLAKRMERMVQYRFFTSLQGFLISAIMDPEGDEDPEMDETDDTAPAP